MATATTIISADRENERCLLDDRMDLDAEEEHFKSLDCAFQTNEDGQTALHLFCMEPTGGIEACKELFDSNPAAVNAKDAYGRTPLFYAIQFGCSIDIVSLVFQANQQAINQQDFCGESPLYLIFHRTTDPSVVKTIFQHQPELALQRVHSFAGPTLVQVVCSPWERLLSSFTTQDLQREGPLRNQWQKVVWTVAAAHKCKFPFAGRNKPELHQALEMRCSPKILCWYLRIYPWQARIPVDGTNGQLPLHSFFTKGVPLSRSEQAIRAFISAYPEATMTPWNGKYPLHQAIESSCPIGTVEALLIAAPDVLQIPCSTTGLAPFLLAASQASEVESIYMMLREEPTMLLR